ncbi:DUF998 domain-containing protein [Streptomyces sp. NBC_01506]|uniref:DUF998 domain-containing protein n=1 Tax=Streptomyces sp. NBC_01506 TaxID=2903887 RepID=UPI00386669EE
MGNQPLLTCGVAAGPLFTAAYALLGAVRPGYNSRRYPVSSLTLGPGGRTQTAAFLASGLLSLAFAVGLWRTGSAPWGALLVGAWGAGLLGAGAFRTDPVRGYPPGTPDQPRRPTPAGTLHDLLSLAGFLALTAACFTLAPSGPPAWTVYSIASGVLFATTTALSEHLPHLGGCSSESPSPSAGPG